MTRHIRTHRPLRVEALEIRTAPTVILGATSPLLTRPMLSPQWTDLTSHPHAGSSGSTGPGFHAGWDINKYATM